MNAIRRSAAVLAAGALLALAACGGENPAARPEELKEPTWDSGSEPSDGGGKSDGGGEATKAVPDIPPPDPKDFPGMDQKTDKGAEQAARYFIHVMLWAHQTGESDLYKTLYNDDCESCAKILEYIQKMKKEGEYWSPASFEINKADLAYKNYPELEFHFRTSLGPMSAVPSDGTERKSYAASQIIIGIRVEWNNSRWIVEAYVAKDKGANSGTK